MDYLNWKYTNHVWTVREQEDEARNDEPPTSSEEDLNKEENNNVETSLDEPELETLSE